MLPPQSASDSPSFCTVSEQVAASHSLVLLSQIRLSQSVLTLQCCFAVHGAQFMPPQSMSVSWPFLVMSVQPGSTHRLESQSKEAQSIASLAGHARRARGASAAAVDARFVSVADAITTARRLTHAGRARTARAVRLRVAAQTGFAQDRATPAAVLVALGTVLDAVRASCGFADAFLTVRALAVRVLEAALASRAHRADATAVDASLVRTLNAIPADWRRGGVRAGFAYAAAIDARFVRALHAVVTS